MSSTVLWYPANMINYIRVGLIIVMLFNIKKRPITCFVASTLGGFIDLIDGPISRSSKTTSKLGQALDVTMDRMTFIILVIFLARLYPKHWHLFSMITFIEIVRDLVGPMLRFQNTMLDLVNSILRIDTTTGSSLINNVNAFNEFKIDLLGMAGIDANKYVAADVIKNYELKFKEQELIKPQESEFGMNLIHIRNYLIPYTW